MKQRIKQNLEGNDNSLFSETNQIQSGPTLLIQTFVLVNEI